MSEQDLRSVTPIERQTFQNRTPLDDLYLEYPRLKAQQFQYIDSRGTGKGGGNMSETYPADEEWNPLPGRPTLEQFSPDMSQKDLLGETLHILRRTDPQVAKMRDEFINSMTDEQKQRLAEQYEYAQKNEGERRPFAEWRDMSGHDAWFRGHITGQWPEHIYTPQQRELFQRLDQYLRSE